jgi:hypothetical protein
MTLGQAINILTDLLGEGPQFSPDKRREAVSLGIEALKAVKDVRANNYYTPISPLPGETAE